MNEEEKAKIDAEIEELLKRIEEGRKKEYEKVSKMTDEEQFEYYKQQCKKANEFAKKSGMKTITTADVKKKR